MTFFELLLRYFRRRSWFQIAWFIGTVLLTSVFLFFVARRLQGSLWLKPFFSDQPTPIKVALYILIGAATAITFLRTFLNYLDTGSSVRSAYDSVSSEKLRVQLNMTQQVVENQLESVKKSIENIGTVKFDIGEIDKAQLLDTLKSSITGNLNDIVFKTIDEEFAKRDLKNKQWEGLIGDFAGIRKRLYDETNNLSRRANINLAFGTLTTILAGVGLVVIVLLRPLDLAGLTKDEYAWKVIAHYIPRLSLIVFAEVFAYFFLRLYKTSLSDIKYYQNEISNVELKLIALKAGLTIQDKGILKLVIEELSKTERNFVLKKGETTLDLEKAKLDGADTAPRELLEKVTAIKDKIRLYLTLSSLDFAPFSDTSFEIHAALSPNGFNRSYSRRLACQASQISTAS